MMDNLVRLEEALLYMNRRRAMSGQEPIKRRELAAMLFDQIPPTTAAQYWSQLKNGNRMSALEPRHIVKLCRITGVTADYLLGITNEVRPGYEQEAG